MADILVLQDINPSGIGLDETKYITFAPSQYAKPCVGCFGCWVKTPGKCVINDEDSNFAAIMPHVREVLVISELVFGGLSPDVKRVLDRSIGFILPFFNNIDGEMHHKQRYTKRPTFRWMLYSSAMTEAEKETAQKLAKANAINLGADSHSVDFYASAEEILEGLQ